LNVSAHTARGWLRGKIHSADGRGRRPYDLGLPHCGKVCGANAGMWAAGWAFEPPSSLPGPRRAWELRCHSFTKTCKCEADLNHRSKFRQCQRINGRRLFVIVCVGIPPCKGRDNRARWAITPHSLQPASEEEIERFLTVSMPAALMTRTFVITKSRCGAPARGVLFVDA